jgi:hypothetical protein
LGFLSGACTPGIPATAVETQWCILPQWRFRIRGQLNVLMVSIPEIG